MRTLLLFFISTMLSLCTSHSGAQQITRNWNLNFDAGSELNDMPRGWFKWGNESHNVGRDTSHAYSGKASGCVAFAEGEGFGAIAYKIPAEYAGTEITLTGYIKLENVEDWAGLLLRIDGSDGPLEFSNMQNENIHGTFDWKKFSITLPYPEQAENIFVAGIMSGKGKAWFDNFEITIDDIDIHQKETVSRVQAEAEAMSNTEFDGGSKIEIEELNNVQQQNLMTLCKVWGYTKYRHPAIADGQLQWDYELFSVMPAIISSISKDEANEILLDWLRKLQVPDSYKKASDLGREIKLTPTTEWITDENLTGINLSRWLQDLETMPTAKENYYIGFVKGIGNPIFKNELGFNSMKYSDDGLRLIALFRYWNMIEYFFPYKHLMDDNWDNVLAEFIPKMTTANNNLDYKLCLLELIERVKDTHANIWMWDDALQNHWGANHIPIALKYIDGQFVVTDISPEVDGKFQLGDIILSIDDNSVKDRAEYLKKYSPASNTPTQFRNISRRIMRTNKSSIVVEFERSEKLHSIELNTSDVRSTRLNRKDIPSHKMLDDNIGYIYPQSLKKDEIHEIMKKFEKTDGLIVDLRCYPSDFIVFKLGEYLMPEATEFAKFTQGSLSNPGEFSFGEALSVGSHNDNFYKNKVIILIDETSQSQAEYTTMALRVSPNAIVVGSTTAGADGNVSSITLPGGVKTMISGIGVYYPDDTETQRIGIIPDIEIHPTIEGIKAGRDELLEKAISLILN